MLHEARVLPREPVPDLAAYRAGGGGRALAEARAASPDLVIEEVVASGLRGRGGAGFPTGRKWRTMADNASELIASTVVVNAAEGEPGCFKDRAIVRADPFRALEGALIAAYAIGAGRVVFATKRSFERERARLAPAIAEARAAGWADGIDIEVFAGPSEYLYGEETALLEVLDGRYPFPRIAPPFRRGFDEVVETDADADTGTTSAAHVELAGPAPDEIAPPTLVENLETIANIAGIVARGAEWFRTVGTPECPGTMVCTISGDVRRAGVAEIPMGTLLREAIESVGGGVLDGRRVKAVLVGASSPLVEAEHLDTPLTFEHMRAIGSGLGAGGYLVLDDAADLAAVAAGVARFLAVESCGQCTPCKWDGLSLRDLLAKVCANEADERDLDEIRGRVATVADGARCSLAYQHQDVIGSVVARHLEELEAHVRGRVPPVEVAVITPILDLVDGQVLLDDHEAAKQPDWTYEAVWSGRAPADRLDDHRGPAEDV